MKQRGECNFPLVTPPSSPCHSSIPASSPPPPPPPTPGSGFGCLVWMQRPLPSSHFSQNIVISLIFLLFHTFPRLFAAASLISHLFSTSPHPAESSLWDGHARPCVSFNQKNNVLTENESDADSRQKQSHALHSPTVDNSYIALLGEAYWSQT